MLVGAVVCPHPPLIVPEVAAGAASELDVVRAACDRAVSQLLGLAPTMVAVVGRAQTCGELAGAGGSFAGFGVALAVGAEPRTLPLAHTVGCWLLDRARWTGLRSYWGATDDARPRLPDDDRLAVVVMGDASARRSEKAPGYFDPTAADYDAEVVAALRAGPGAVAALDGTRARQLLVAGWPAWQTLADAATGRRWRCDVVYEGAPYGVGYIVASWLPP